MSMSKINDKSLTIYEAMKNIENGKYVMPAFQRQFVWSMEQIEKLWDSILLDYPIATFLFWRVDDTNVTQDTYFCNFLQDVTFDSRKSADSVNYELSNISFETTDTAILDGQQRLTSLFLSLLGQARIRQLHARRKTGATTLSSLYVELDENKITIDEEEYNSKKFDIKFSIYANSPTQFEIKNILAEKFQNNETREQAIETAIANVPMNSKDYARNILKILHKKIFVEKLIRYTEMMDMKQDDALEMFVWFNSGGKALRKSEITMSILEAYWPSARSEFGKILVGSYDGFGTDFIIRTALMLYGDVVKSNINKKIAEALKNDWSGFKKALNNLDILFKSMKIDVSRFQSSWNVLLPIIYYIYYNTNYNDNVHAIRVYLLRAILFTFFQSGTTGKLQKIKSKINDNNFEITVDMLNRMSREELLMMLIGVLDGAEAADDFVAFIIKEFVKVVYVCDNGELIIYYDIEHDPRDPNNKKNKGIPKETREKHKEKAEPLSPANSPDTTNHTKGVHISDIVVHQLKNGNAFISVLPFFVATKSCPRPLL